MPKLLSLNSYHYRRGGADAVYFDHAALMESKGWENAFFSMQFPKNFSSPWSDYFVDEIQIGHDYTLLEKIAKASKVVYSFEAQKKLRKLIADYEPDIAHIHNIYHHISPSVLPVLRKSGVPVVMTAHDLKIACPNNKMLAADGICERCHVGKYYNAVLNRCTHGQVLASTIIAAESYLHRWLRSYEKNVDRIVVPSQFFIRKLVEWGWPEEKFEYIPNFVEAGKFSPQFSPGRSVVFFGRLAVEKGVETLIRASSSARVPVQIVGTGPMEAQLKALAQELGAPVEFLGYRSGQELFGLVGSSRATVLPSEWYENAPISVLESMALGTPVIGADVGGIPEMVREGETGWLFPSGNVDALADTLTAVATSSDERVEQMGRRGRQLVEQEFSPERYTSAVTELYGELGVVSV